MWGKVRSAGSIVLGLVFLLSIGVTPAGAAMTAEFVVSAAPGNQLEPAVYGNKIVWQDLRGPSEDIYVHDLLTGSEIPVSVHPADQKLPDIYQDLVVYQDDRNFGVPDVFLTDLGTGVEQQLTPTGTRQDQAAIWGDTVVWRDQRNGTYDIYSRSLSTGFETRLTASPADQAYPDICGDVVVYQDIRNGQWDIYAYDLSVGMESRITTDFAAQLRPKVGDDLIAWLDSRFPIGAIYAYDLSTQTEFLVAVPTVGPVEILSVSGDRVVWREDILQMTFVYDHSTGSVSPLPLSGAPIPFAADIFGDKIVISALNGPTYDIYMATIDEDAPTTTASGIPSDWVSSPVTVTLTADDGIDGCGVDATYYSLNGDPVTTYSGPFVVAADGTTQIEYWSEDLAANIEATNTATVKIDTLAPATTSDINSAWQDGPVTVTLASVDGDGSGVAWTLYSVDGGPLQTYTGPFVVSGEGQHVVSYTSADEIGHAEILHTEFVRIDNSDPVTVSDIDSAWQNGPVTVTLTATDPYSGVATTYYSTDGSFPTQVYTGPFTLSAEGTTTVTFYSVDSLSHAETPTTEFVRIDNTAPNTSSDIDSAWQNGPVTVTLTATDPHSGVAATLYSLNGATPTTYTAPLSITAEGTTTVDYFSVDSIGQTESTSSEIVRIDDTAPTTSSDIDPDWQVGPVTVNLTAIDTLSGIDATYYSTDGSFPTTPYTGSFVVSADGITTVKYYSVDIVGNTESVATEQVKIDNEAPDTSSDIDSAWQNGPVTVTLSAVDDDSGPITTRYSIDGTDPPDVSYAGPFVVSAEGTTTVRYYSVDVYGHVETPTAEIVRIDNTAPVTTSDIDPAWQTGPVTVTLIPTDPYSGVTATYYYIDGQAPARPYTGPFEVSAEGETLVTFYSIDALGQVEAPVTDTVRIDNSAPETASDIDSAWQTGPVTVTLTATDPHSGVDATYFSVDGSTPTVEYTGPFVISDEGTTTVKFYSVDNYGHVESETTQIVQIDNTMPKTYSDVLGKWENGPVTVSLMAKDAYSGIAETYYSLDGSAPGLSYRDPIVITDEGTTTVKYYSVDVYGHAEGVRTEYVYIDNTAPETTSDIDSDWQTSPVSVTLTATDPYSGVEDTFYSTDGSTPSILYSGPFTITAEGTTTVKFRSVDVLGHMESETTEIVRIDDTAPVTIDDAPADWQTSPVAVTLTAVDPLSGVAVTYYSLDGSIPTVVYSGPIMISTEGTTTIKYYSVDNYGHSEAVNTAIVRIDDTIPVTETDIDSSWRSAPATVTLSTNAEWIYYSVDGSEPTTLYSGPFVISAEGTTTVKYKSESKAHVFEATQAEDVRIDYTPPATTTDAEELFWDIAYIPVSATDSLSGVATSYMRLDGGEIVETADITVTRLGEHTVEFWSVDIAGNVESAGSHSFTVKPSTTDFEVVAGADRISTAVQVSQSSYPEGADYIVVATGRNWPDALGGAALAGAYDAPILLVNGSLTDSVANEIRRLAPEKALILGGVGAVSEEIEGHIREIVGVGAVERFWGDTRFDTADTIAYRVLERLGSAYDGTAFVVTGASFPDAVAGSPMAAANGWPIFLATADGLPAGTKSTMADVGVTNVIVMGGEGVVSAGVYADLEATFGSGNVTRLAGATRYDTALEAARFGTTQGNLMWDGVALATGEDFADALTGGVLQGLKGSTMLLTRPNSLPVSVDAELEAKRDYIGSVVYLGGDAAVGPAVRSRIGQILR